MDKKMGSWESVGRGLLSTILGESILRDMMNLEARKREDYEGKFVDSQAWRLLQLRWAVGEYQILGDYFRVGL